MDVPRLCRWGTSFDFTRNMKSFCDSEADAKGMSVIYCGEPYDLYQDW